MSWDRVAAAQVAFGVAYSAHVKAMQEERAGSKKQQAAFETMLEAHRERREALLEQWDPDKDGYRADEEDTPSVGRVLQRYYAENPPENKVVKR